MNRFEIVNKIKEIDTHLEKALVIANEIEENGGTLTDLIIISDLFENAFNKFDEDDDEDE